MTYVVGMTKGGVGKTVIATNGIPSLFIGEDKKINIYELDNNNVTGKTFLKSKLNFQTLRADESKEKIYEVSFAAMSDDDSVINIIDAGGGDDTLDVLFHLKTSGIEGITYVVPINDDPEQVDNAKQTIREIKAFNENPKIFVVLNQCKKMTVLGVEEQFVGLFGSKKYAMESTIEDEEFKDVEFVFVSETIIFGILKAYYQQTVYDVYPDAKELLDNFNEVRKEWHKEGKEYYMKQMGFKEFALDLVALTDELRNNLSPLKGN